MISSLFFVLLIVLISVLTFGEDVDYTETPTAKLVVYKVNLEWFR